MEESAGTISSMEAFNPKKKKLWWVIIIVLNHSMTFLSKKWYTYDAHYSNFMHFRYVVRIRLPAEMDSKAIDFDLDDKKNTFVLFSHK